MKRNIFLEGFDVKVVGIDLAGTSNNPTGFASLHRRVFKTELIYRDDEIIELCQRLGPAVVAIDAPLSLPERGNLRSADITLIKRGLRVFPPTFGGMRSLTSRGIRIAFSLRTMGFEVIEVHPRTSGVILFGKADKGAWSTELRKRGWKLGKASEHEIDAAIAALTGWLWLKGKFEEVGEPNEGTIIIPLGRL
jgi:predicted nuclease with RNAse H fold